MATVSRLLIDYGDVPSLAALATQRDAATILLWHPQSGEAGMAARRTTESHQEIFAAGGLEIAEIGSMATQPSVPAGLYQSYLLSRAVIAAVAHRCHAIIWPITVGPDAAAVASLVERTLAFAALTELDTGEEMHFDMPVVEMSNAAIVDLADDAGAPMHACWPCERDAAEPCGGCPSCRRWMSAFQQADVAWPWASVGT